MKITQTVKNSHGYCFRTQIDNSTNIMSLSKTTFDVYPNALFFFDISTLTDIKDSCMAFDGKHELIGGKKVFVQNDIPHMAYIKTNGDLFYCEFNSDLSTHFQLATSIISCCVIKGWNSVINDDDNQGYICAYIKSNKTAWYRRYYYHTLSGTTYWDDEVAFTGLPLNLKKISAFKPNDYRVGFIFQTDTDEDYWTISDRTWAAMAVGTEYLSGTLKDLSITVHPVTYWDTFTTEHLSVGLSDMSIALKWGLSPVPQSASNPDAIHIQITFDHEIYNVTGQQAGFTVKDSNNIVFAVTGTAYGSDNKTLILSVSDFNNANGSMTINYDSSKASINGETVLLATFNISFTPIGLVPTATTPPVPTLIYNIA